MRLIDADKLIEFIDLGHLRPPTEVCFSEYDVCEMIKQAPTIEEKKHGEWYAYEKYSQWLMHYKCSECNAIALDSYKYCPNCGAKMDD